MAFRVKICGITEVGDAIAAIDAGADALGINTYARSPRFVREETAREIGNVLSSERGPTISLVGVFVNHTLDDIQRFWAWAGHNSIVQIHGDESPDFVARIKTARCSELVAASRWQVIRVRRLADGDLVEVQDDLAACARAGARPDAVLIDAASTLAYGGTGSRVPWSRIAEHSQLLDNTPLILAGGLTPDNVAEAIRIVRPYGVDVASGVESSPGKKDPLKVRDFIAAARDAFARNERDTGKNP